MEQEIKELITKWNCKYQDSEMKSMYPGIIYEFVEDLKSLLELYRSQLIPDKKIWKLKYINRLIKFGLTKKQALENYRAIDEIDLTIDPEIAVDEEISYGEG